MGLSIIILAAGQGKRMRSALPKVLHRLAGRTLLEHVLATARTLSPDQIIVVYGHGGAQVRDALAHETDIEWVLQETQDGTAHAVGCTLALIQESHGVLVLYGDVPLIGHTTLRSLYTSVPQGEIGLVTTYLDHPLGYGRIVREKHRITHIVEERDASDEQRKIKEVNTGIILIPAHCLEKWIPEISNDNTQKEYYLTDMIALAANENIKIHAVHPQHPSEVLGVNDKQQLATLERYYQSMMAHGLLDKGVTLMDPLRVDLRGEVEVGEDVVIDINVIFKGKVILGPGCYVGPSCVLKNVELGEGVRVEAFSYIEDSVIERDCVIGPYARIRPGTHVGAGAKVGNFVEVKKSHLGAGVKINHLSYIGDTEIGARTNIGAGTITCNYDGAHKHKTTIGSDVFIGSDCQLIAPITIGDDATIGAGSTLTRDAPAHELTLSRSKQETIKGWKRPLKKKET